MTQFFGDPDVCAARQDHLDALYEASLPRCVKCNQPITEKIIDYHGDFYHRDCFLEAAGRFADENTISVEEYLNNKEEF